MILAQNQSSDSGCSPIFNIFNTPSLAPCSSRCGKDLTPQNRPHTVNYALIGRAIGQSFGPDSECISSMSLYIWFWRVTRDKPFAVTTGLTFFFYVWLILVPIVGVIFFRLWCV